MDFDELLQSLHISYCLQNIIAPLWHVVLVPHDSSVDSVSWVWVSPRSLAASDRPGGYRFNGASN